MKNFPTPGEMAHEQMEAWTSHPAPPQDHDDEMEFAENARLDLVRAAHDLLPTTTNETHQQVLRLVLALFGQKESPDDDAPF